MTAQLIQNVKRVDFLIRHKATGNFRQCSRKLGISTATFYRLMEFIKEDLEAPVRYNSFRGTYEYEREGRIYFGWREKK